MSGSEDHADDLLQATVEKALTHADQFKTGQRLDAWIYRIMKNSWIDGRRYEARRKLSRADVEALDPSAQHPEPELRDDVLTVSRLFAALPEEERVVLVLVAVDGLSYQEAAAVLKISVRTVMKRLFRARTTLAEGLAGSS